MAGKMQKIILLVGVVLTFLVSAAFGESQPIKGEVRDASGKAAVQDLHERKCNRDPRTIR